ncbi:uncharacterized protein LOC129802413 isoform X1 [Phlebotomus papatasi]|uniref:uncharacterized protein LOC129802413 isoform X1 n=1 Tax=Phlebotomus papatasi TaxID=29031 RepID=UPI0024835B1B|nr:uncharacterized protein LOC129802413 isoform X1 [Phlebotomus papatasi]
MMSPETLNVLAIVHVVSAFFVEEFTGENVGEESTEENNSTVCDFLTAAPEDLPRQGLDMDTITIIWYFSTFVALVAFFVVMACSDNYCGRPRKPEEPPRSAPPTPAPSYREFAPPSYDSVMKRYKNRVFIVPVSESSTETQVTQVQEVVVHPPEQPTTSTSSDSAESPEMQVERF